MSASSDSASGPLIGLTGRRKTAGSIAGTPESLRHLEGDWFYADYARGVLAAGGVPVNLPLDVDPGLFADRLDGIVLSGGADIDPNRYGHTSETDDFPPEPERDEFEFTLLDAAIARDLPILGICRGLQLVNIHAGGTLHQHVPEHGRFDLAPSTETHAVDLAEGSTVHELYGSTITVNSLHHQTVDEVGADLAVTATAGDTVEALEHRSRPLLAVQWHPEMMTSRDSDPVFAWIVDQARRLSRTG